jgi:acyl-CoA reductase-like NAD-dependent aldehyde dehydrogenase
MKDKLNSSKLFIDGKWVEPELEQYFNNMNPTSRKTFGSIADATATDVNDAITGASKAQTAWAALPPSTRADFFYKAAELFKLRQEYFVNTLIQETGSTLGKAMYECSIIPLALCEAAALTTRPNGEILPSNVPGKVNTIIRQPLGVVGAISPWNFPLYLSLRSFIYAIALGNTAVLKPSEDSPLTGGLMIAELLQDAGFPKGVLNVITCSRDNVKTLADQMIKDPRIDCISFTGSTAVGREISVACAQRFKRVMLEMGGKNPIIILADADLEYAVNVAFFGAFLHQGQICMSADKIIVPRNLYALFVEKFTSKVRNFSPMDPHNEYAVIGPIINDRQLKRIHHLVSEAKKDGAVIQTGGNIEGSFYQPTVITDITPDMEIYRDEIFGPVALIIPVDSEEEAINVANDTPYGLTAAIISADTHYASVMALKLDSGMVHINDSTVHDEPHCPFGGMKDSGGVGKWGGTGAIEAFTKQHWISTQQVKRVYPF